MRIAVDVMGTDYGPGELVLGAVNAVKELGCEVTLVGLEDTIKELLVKYKADKDERITIKHATQVIAMDEHPAVAMRKKKDASIVVAAKLLKTNECDALVSSGSTGAAVSASLFFIGRVPGVEKPAICTPVPSIKGSTAMLDSGAIVDARPEDFVLSAIMGSVYAEKILKIPNPKVGLINIGEEETKGNAQVLAARPLLLAEKDINFIGNCEGRDICMSNVDVAVCDGFVGNCLLKFGEGMARAIFTIIKQAAMEGGLLAKLGAALLAPSLKKKSKNFSADEHGGALLLGVKAPVVICHGNSKAKAITNAIKVAVEFVKQDVTETITQRVAASLERKEEIVQ